MRGAGASRPTPVDEIRPLYRTVLALGAAGIVILAVGLVEFVSFEPFGERTGTTARIEGVFRYDPSAHRVIGSASTRFTIDDDFAAVVDWGSLPDSMTVAARWYNALQTQVGQVGPAPAVTLHDQQLVPVKVPHGFTRNLPGEYVFVVERYARGQPVELLARRLVLVRRTP